MNVKFIEQKFNIFFKPIKNTSDHHIYTNYRIYWQTQSRILANKMTYYTWVPGFSDIGRTRFSITFALYVKKIFISRVCKCVTRNVFSMCRNFFFHQYVKPCLSKNPRELTFLCNIYILQISMRNESNLKSTNIRSTTIIQVQNTTKAHFKCIFFKWCLSKNPRYTCFTIKSSLMLTYKSQMFFFVCLQSILDLCSTLVCQAKSHTYTLY
jgi:hypothetical protein